MEGGVGFAGIERRANRSSPDRSAIGRDIQRSPRRRIQHFDLSRGWTVTRWLGTGVSGRCGLSCPARRFTDYPYLSRRLEAIRVKGARRFVPGRTQVVFGEPIMPDADMSSRKVAARLGSDVARLADEATSSWWEATQRFARGATPSLSGPETTSWRRSWALHERRRRTKSGRPRPRPEWPHLS